MGVSAPYGWSHPVTFSGPVIAHPGAPYGYGSEADPCVRAWLQTQKGRLPVSRVGGLCEAIELDRYRLAASSGLGISKC